ncbi:hypothetical protein R3X27_02790 [Tropicimonas sp. TH_r6]|uniref:hypothetical protein n=1 Tax=Tropicimonas sp. TH_r6 TaxID=3082085 RepID=UPI0029531B58|nr:hypothetical protein [Tropicimonas sp. TH_r6]MDV7141601.1 hypothetical protein [Tropicimonas sp. TH_r6]
MTEDFALIDFALSARSPTEVAEAVGRAASGAGAPTDAAETTPPKKPGLIRRLLGGGKLRKNAHAQMPENTLHIQPAGTVGPTPLTRVVLTESGGSPGPVRISGPIGVARLTLIEFLEGDGETSLFSERLSTELTGDELFYFRYSGSRHPGAHFSFHVYQDGRATRRADSISAEGDIAEADWRGTDAGMPHPVEADSLPPPGTPHSEIMTPVRQAIILEALGIDPDLLFGQSEDPEMVVLELSTAVAGHPVSEAANAIRTQLSPDIHATGPVPADMATTPVAASVATPVPEALADPALLAESAEAAGAATTSWEEEVTGLLVKAVETALPGDQQVGWLDQLTQQLLGGDIDGALEEARTMIFAGERPDAEKKADLARLAQLFGRG